MALAVDKGAGVVCGCVCGGGGRPSPGWAQPLTGTVSDLETVHQPESALAGVKLAFEMNNDLICPCQSDS